jgi:Na+/H+ antiporter NhaD/arsenite permease-like protein
MSSNALLLMFAGLFVVVAGFEKAVVSDDLVARIVAFNLDDIRVLSVVTAVLSNIVSNVPAVLVLKPFVEALAEPDRAWLIVAMASTLAGNFTLLGSVANLIVAEKARAENIEIDFWSYFRIGAPLTIVTIVIGVLMLG